MCKFCKEKASSLLKRRQQNRLCFAKLHLNKSQDFWKDVLWTNEAKVEMFGQYILYNAMSGENQTQRISTNTSYQLSSTAMEG